MRAASALFRIANAAMAILFLAAAVQRGSDPDPARWIALYTAAAAGCILLAPSLFFWWRIALAGAATGWACLLCAQLVDRLPIKLDDLFLHMEMRGGGVELARQAFGLALVAMWMITLAVVQRRRI
jgi:hypothetical protein